jgi:hypothetical protein
VHRFFDNYHVQEQEAQAAETMHKSKKLASPMQSRSFTDKIYWYKEAENKYGQKNNIMRSLWSSD